MNLQNLQLALSQSNDSNKSYTFASPRPQQFSLPYPIMKYIFTNPSSGKAWKKLIQTCKYFFSKNAIYPIECLKYDYFNEWNADGKIFDPMENVAKLWIYDKIGVNSLFNKYAPLISSLIPKIDKCDLHSLEIFGQYLNFDEYQFLTSSGDLKELHLFNCTIKHSDGTLVTFDQFFENIPKLEEFDMYCASNSSSMFQGDTFKKLAEMLPSLKELFYFNLYDLTEEFDFASMTDILLKNKNLKFTLEYYNPLSDAYKEIVESFIAKIIDTPPKRIPTIMFPEFQNSIYFYDYQKLCHYKNITL